MTTDSRDDTCGTKVWIDMPDKPGYYWARRTYQPEHRTIVEISQYDKHGEVTGHIWVYWFGVDRSLPNRLCGDLAYEFAGPILPPED